LTDRLLGQRITPAYRQKALGNFHRAMERDGGSTIYMFDSEGNYLELHFPRPGGRRQRQAN
jgi:hypothetical protein